MLSESEIKMEENCEQYNVNPSSSKNDHSFNVSLNPILNSTMSYQEYCKKYGSILDKVKQEKMQTPNNKAQNQCNKSLPNLNYSEFCAKYGSVFTSVQKTTQKNGSSNKKCKKADNSDKEMISYEEFKKKYGSVFDNISKSQKGISEKKTAVQVEAKNITKNQKNNCGVIRKLSTIVSEEEPNTNKTTLKVASNKKRKSVKAEVKANSKSNKNNNNSETTTSLAVKINNKLSNNIKTNNSNKKKKLNKKKNSDKKKNLDKKKNEQLPRQILSPKIINRKLNFNTDHQDNQIYRKFKESILDTTDGIERLDDSCASSSSREFSKMEKMCGINNTPTSKLIQLENKLDNLFKAAAEIKKEINVLKFNQTKPEMKLPLGKVSDLRLKAIANRINSGSTSSLDTPKTKKKMNAAIKMYNSCRSELNLETPQTKRKFLKTPKKGEKSKSSLSIKVQKQCLNLLDS